MRSSSGRDHHFSPATAAGRICCVLLLAALLLPALPLQAGQTVFKHINRQFLRSDEVRILADEDYFPALEQIIDSARSQISLVMFLFKTSRSKNNRPAQIADALIRARQRGVQVEVLLEKSNYDDELNRINRRVAKRLKKNDVTVYFDTKGTTTHAKLLVVDRTLCLLGSHNLTQAALRYNHEVSLLISNRQLAAELLDYIKSLPHHAAN